MSQTGIDIQERTFKFGVRIIKFVDKLPRTLSATELGRQLLRSGTSIAANMEEANGAESKSDFIHKVSIAHKEARETRMWLGMIKAAILPTTAEVAELLDECDEIVRILFAILRKARSNRTTTRHCSLLIDHRSLIIASASSNPIPSPRLIAAGN